jgi:fructose-bisphosphate aldolase class II
MLTSLREILIHARAHAYAVPAFDCVEDVMVRTILETADSHRAPVILMCLWLDLQGNGMTYLPGLIRAAADAHGIPVALHLDHAQNLEQIQAAVDHGFTSVMIDGSELPFDENVALTRAAVRLARARNVSVEGELGHVGGMDLEATQCGESVLTEPHEVARFVAETGVDALAVSIGTSHGVYRSLPTLAIDRLKALNAVSPVPLVLHGGSGTPEDQIREAVRNGICKLNLYADCRIAMGQGLKQAAASLSRIDPTPQELFGPIRERLGEVVRQKIQLLSAENRSGEAGAAA